MWSAHGSVRQELVAACCFKPRRQRRNPCVIDALRVADELAGDSSHAIDLRRQSPELAQGFGAAQEVAQRIIDGNRIVDRLHDESAAGGSSRFALVRVWRVLLSAHY